jgi:hypothetical protein
MEWSHIQYSVVIYETGNTWMFDFDNPVHLFRSILLQFVKGPH